MNDTCFICKREVPQYHWNRNEPGARIKCERCGEYRLSEALVTKVGMAKLPDSHIYSGAIREHYERGSIIWVASLDELVSSVVVPKTPLDSIDRILLHILQKTNSADKGIEIPIDHYPLAYAKNYGEFMYFLEKAGEIGYIEQPSGSHNYRLALKGWERVAAISQTAPNPNQAFVAMSYNSALLAAWEEGFEPAIRQTGYDPIRLDRTEFNNRIDDEIIAIIRKSGLLIADFTDHRGGVYFEAGFAMGLGIPVIWTCRRDDIDNLHFDTRQYNYIDWADPNELKERLVNRIEATVPRRAESMQGAVRPSLRM